MAPLARTIDAAERYVELLGSTPSGGRQSLLLLWVAYVFFTLVLPFFVAGMVADHFGKSFVRWGTIGGAIVFVAASLTVLTLTAWTP